MQATAEQVKALCDVAEIDRKIVTATHELENLPQRKAIVDVRDKVTELEAKREQVLSLAEEAKATVTKFVTEDEQLVTKAAATQTKIDEAGGDFRAVESLTRDLAGIAKRRETVAFKKAEAETKQHEVEEVLKRADTSISALKNQESELIGEFKARGGQLQEGIAKAKALRSGATAVVSDELMAAYDASYKRNGGIAMAHLKGDCCSACRNTIIPSRLSQIRSEAPLSTCPNCSRLLVVGA